MEITSYYIDENNVLHTFINEMKHITISDVFTEDEALILINEENEYLSNQQN